jgi:FtsP/CotA-like multicopper oxidase with cupredoxin domain
VSPSKRTDLVLAVVTIVALAAVVSVLALGPVLGNPESTGTTSTTALPADCVRPAGGFLIVVSKYGYNDSILQGAGPSKPFPLIDAKEGQTVNITVCNVDIAAHGFQVAGYLEGNINIIDPGKALSFSFVASHEGTFGIYCAIPCDIHVFLQYGQLRVTV